MSFVRLTTPLSQDEHINNLNKIRTVLLMNEQYHTHVYFYLSQEHSSLSIEHIAHYYSEVLSNHVQRNVVFVLPFRSTNVQLKYIENELKNLNVSSQGTHIYFSDEEEEKELSSLLSFVRVPLNNVDSELESIWKQYYPFEVSQTNSYAKYNVVCLGGTFDRLHFGHQLMLTCLAMIMNTNNENAWIEIGLSGDPLLQKKEFKELIEPWNIRRDSVIKTLKTVHPGLFVHSNPDAIRISELLDPYGPSTAVPEIEALVISEETRRGGESVNKIRVEKGMNPADLICVPVIQARDGKEKVSSTQRRQQDFDAQQH
jgi:phosphopantetheine adenylyltransferase